MAKKSKRKGSKFERDIAKAILAVAKPYGFTEEDCYRTPMSGGHRVASKKDPGDLQLSDRLAEVLPFSIECKNQKTFNLERFLVHPDDRAKSWSEWEWIAQTMKASTKNRAPVLICKSSKGPVFVFMRKRPSYNDWFEDSLAGTGLIEFTVPKDRAFGTWVGMPLRAFLENLKYLLPLYFKKERKSVSNKRVQARSKSRSTQSRRKVR